MKELVILTPAVIDEECIEKSQKSLEKNLIETNLDTQFLQLIHVDPNKRAGAKGDIQSIQEIYRETYRKYSKNYSAEVAFSSEKIGLVQTGFLLFKAFLNSKKQCSFIFEDDTTLKKIINLEKIDELLKSSDMVHLSFGVKNGEKSYSTEDPFIFGEQKKSGNLFYYDRNFVEKPSFTWNGTFLDKSIIENFINDYDLKKNERNWPEDQLGRFFHKKMKNLIVRTVFDDSSIEENLNQDSWSSKISQNYHIIFDEIRYQRGASFHGASK